MTSEAQMRAVLKYKKKVKRISVEFCPTETELWEHLQAQDRKQTYLKELIRRDLTKKMA